jgi:hypothetical protein
MLGGTWVQERQSFRIKEDSLIKEARPASIETDPEFHPLLLAVIALSPIIVIAGLVYAFISIF